MTALAAAVLGYRVAVLGPEGRYSPAGQVSWWAGLWGSDYAHRDVQTFLDHVGPGGVITLDWENVPLALVQRCQQYGCAVRPGPSVLHIAQDRVREKNAVSNHGLGVGPFQPIAAQCDMVSAQNKGALFPAILKTRSDGYDGKGQLPVASGEVLPAAWNELQRAPCILERRVQIACELSVIVACRPHDDTCVVYGPFENRHENGVLRETVFPAQVTAHVAGTVRAQATALARGLGVHGLLTVEFFVTTAGDILFNEMAPRPHNSGHGTIESHATSQFEQLVRAICNLPWGAVTPAKSFAMRNILGAEVDETPSLLQEGHLHLYGKDLRPGRKMGHHTILV